MSEDATYEDMVAYSKDIWNAALTIGAVKGAGSVVKGKTRGLKNGTETLAQVVEQENAIKGGLSSIGNIGNPSTNPKVLQDACEDATAIYGYKPNKTGSLKKFVKYDWSNPMIVAEFRSNRIKYMTEHDSYKNKVEEMRRAGCSDTEIAQRLVLERNNGRLASYIDNAGNIIDTELYNQALEHCISYEDLRNGVGGKKPKTDLEIIESATKTNLGMDACCGLYGHNN